MNKEVKFPLAMLLKEKKFDEECDSLFIHEIRNGDTEWKLIELFERNNKDTYDFLLSCDMDWQKHYLRPTIAQVVMWLYEKHGIWIFCDRTTKWFWTIQKTNGEYIHQEDQKTLTAEVCNGFNSPNEAYEAAIKYVLTNLI